MHRKAGGRGMRGLGGGVLGECDGKLFGAFLLFGLVVCTGSVMNRGGGGRFPGRMNAW